MDVKYYVYEDLSFDVGPGETFDFTANCQNSGEVPISAGAQIIVANDSDDYKKGLVLCESYPYLLSGKEGWVIRYQNVSETHIDGMFRVYLVCQVNATYQTQVLD
ncbi:hypothetical protein [Alkalimarinus alittae]|uniref:Uncharacterized protein n=1 Tax=Alkalimarinus alittae TaxID=2961619 RepID=A0ABY6N070_9ALTE|nr:hypothetical protein [Alkalimarinus alittae]UZE95491.1 hypothetical protein NKI27_15660 [Alkalimarinus alittae]